MTFRCFHAKLAWPCRNFTRISRTMAVLCTILVIASVLYISQAVELSFELPDSERMCFFEEIRKGVKSTLEFQVVTGGNYDVDVELIAPNGQVLYKDVKKQYDSFTWTPTIGGINKFCFSNEFSTFTHKLVYFDFRVGDEDPIVQQPEVDSHRLTQMESASVDVHESLNLIDDYQTHHRLREAQGRAFAEDLNSRVMMWSISESIIVLIIGIGQVFVLRSFFADKKNQGRT